jgi:hypothetical protein
MAAAAALMSISATDLITTSELIVARRRGLGVDVGILVSCNAQQN